MRGSSETPSRAGTSSWDPGAASGPAPARPGSGGGAGVPRQRSGVRFAGANASPAMTPSWKSNTWAGGGAAPPGGGGGADRSPELKGDMDGLLDEEWKANEKQLDRDWYDRWGVCLTALFLRPNESCTSNG